MGGFGVEREMGRRKESIKVSACRGELTYLTKVSEENKMKHFGLG